MNQRRVITLVLAAVLAAAASLLVSTIGSARPAQSLHGLGVVYLHGKAGWPGGMNGGIISELKEEGAVVAAPEMPWSFHRRYDATFDQAMTLAPGHLPEVDNMRSFVSDGVARAKSLIAAGQGNVPHSFPDMAQGVPLTTTATPVVYLSWFDPDGPAVIPKNAAIIGAAASPMPLLWVVGKLDPIDRRGPEYAFDALAKNAKSKYLEIFAGHLTTAVAGRRQVIDWIKGL
jgi:hypothetical protein